MTIHEVETGMTPAAVIEQARSFFALAGTPYAAFTEEVDGRYLKLYMEVGEIIIAAMERNGSTWVRGSASRGPHLLTRFLTTLARPHDVRKTIHRRGFHEVVGARIDEPSYPVLPDVSVELLAEAV